MNRIGYKSLSRIGRRSIQTSLGKGQTKRKATKISASSDKNKDFEVIGAIIKKYRLTLPKKYEFTILEQTKDRTRFMIRKKRISTRFPWEKSRSAAERPCFP